jgi:cytochrome bd-type quinol oxidase subunit 2
MLGAMLLFLIPTLLFVIGFLYETYLSFVRLKNPKNGKSGYVSVTWEVTHTLLIFAVVMLMMLFTKSIDGLSSAIFLSTFIAAFALIVRLICYVYIFYVRKKNKIGAVDWLFALSHVVAALFLVITVAKALWYIYKNNPEVNSQFIPYFIPGLLIVIALCVLPMLTIYSTKK